jgi:hypothetical protein
MGPAAEPGEQWPGQSLWRALASPSRRFLPWGALAVLAALLTLLPLRSTKSELAVERFETPSGALDFVVPEGAALDWVEVIPAQERLLSPQRGVIIDPGRRVAVWVSLVGRSSTHQYIDLGGRVARLSLPEGAYRPAPSLPAAVWPLGRASLGAGVSGRSWLLSLLLALLVVAPSTSVMVRYNFARGRWRLRQFRRLRTLRYGTGMAMVVCSLLPLSVGFARVTWTLGAWSMGRSASIDGVGWTDHLWLASSLGLAIAASAWFSLRHACDWDEVQDAERRLRAEVSEGAPCLSADAALTLADRRLLEGLQDPTLDLSEQLVLAGVRPHVAPISWLSLRAKEALSAGPATGNTLVIARLAKLIHAGLLDLEVDRVSLTLNGLEQLELPRTLFLAPLPVAVRRSMVDAERALREGNARDARVAAGIALEQALKRWLRVVLSPERLGKLESSQGAGREGARGPIDGWSLGPLRDELIGALGAGESDGGRRQAGLRSLDRTKRQRLEQLLRASSGLRNEAPHSGGADDLASPVREIVETGAMLDATRAAIALGEEYTSLLGAPLPERTRGT